MFESLEKEKKYRWHDLRKNPEDLPMLDKEVLVRCIGEVTETCKRQIVAWISPYDKPKCWSYSGGSITQDMLIAWREIEPFEGE